MIDYSPRYMIETRRHPIASYPALDPGGWIEKKNGKYRMRLADLCWLKGRKMTVQKMWRNIPTWMLPMLEQLYERR